MMKIENVFANKEINTFHLCENLKSIISIKKARKRNLFDGDTLQMSEIMKFLVFLFFTYFEIYSFSNKKTDPSSSLTISGLVHASYFQMKNSELFFAVSSAHVSAKAITLNFPFKKLRKSFSLSIFLFRLLIFK